LIRTGTGGAGGAGGRENATIKHTDNDIISPTIFGFQEAKATFKAFVIANTIAERPP
jgi:hypothetical protein